MKKEVNIDEVAELLKKVQIAPESVTREEKKKMKKYLKDPEVFLRAVGIIANDMQDVTPEDGEPKIYEGTEEKIAKNYLDLAYFVVDRMREEGIGGLDDGNIKGLNARIDEDTLTIFLLAQEPIELDFCRYVTSDYPLLEEKLMEIEALQSDIITFGDKDTSFAKIKALIDAGTPD